MKDDHCIEKGCGCNEILLKPFSGQAVQEVLNKYGYKKRAISRASESKGIGFEAPLIPKSTLGSHNPQRLCLSLKYGLQATDTKDH